MDKKQTRVQSQMSVIALDVPRTRNKLIAVPNVRHCAVSDMAINSVINRHAMRSGILAQFINLKFTALFTWLNFTSGNSSYALCHL